LGNSYSLQSRKKRLSRPERHSKIIETAIELFGERGYRGTTTQALAKRAGISEALLYHHFRSKRELFLECLEAIGEEMLDGVKRVLEEGGGNPQKTLEDLLKRLSAQFQKRPEIGRFTLTLLAELDDPEIKNRVRSLFLRAVHLIAGAIRKGQKRGVIDPKADPETLGYLVVSFYQLVGLLHRLQLLGDLSPERFARSLSPFLEREPA
jgi:AcrR family transcriptional regulator